jgi:hypothetical protein
MTLRIRLLRLLVGIAVLAVTLAVLFAAVIPAINRWGATDAEIARARPGDDRLPQPDVSWTNAIDISASPAQVWPWVAQIGDTRGGFYSFTFIENRVGALTGASDYAVVYRNANQIVPAWQQPTPGDALIEGTLDVRAVQPGAWLLAEATQPEIFGWTWLWQLEPIDGGAHTRMINRMRIQLPNAAANPVASFMMDIGGFVMQQRMLQGIKLRAEGGTEPWWMEQAEICLWLAALLCGLIAAGLFIFRPAWLRPLAVAIAAVVALFILTFVQPPIALRAVLDAALLGATWWAARPASSSQSAAPRGGTLSSFAFRYLR